MNALVRQIIFPAGPKGSGAGWTLFGLRLIVGVLMLIHGVQKVSAYDVLSTTFPDPLGMGSQLSLNLAIFAEVLCSVAVICGFMFRLALIPLMVTMIVAGFLVTSAGGWAAQELPVLFLLIYALMFLSGPGRYSLDSYIVSAFTRK